MRYLVRSERGGITVEYAGLVLVVCSLVLALIVAGPGIGRAITGGIERSVCAVLGSCDGGGGSAEGDEEDGGGGGILGTLGDVGGTAWSGLKQAGGVFKGAGEGLWEMGEGLGTLAWNLGKGSVKSSPLWFVIDREGFEEQWQSNADTVGYIVGNPGEVASGIWHGITDPIAEDWRNGNYGEAIGRGLVEIAGAVFGGKGLNKLGKAGRVGSGADELADAGRATRGSTAGGAAVTGVTRADDVIVLGKFPQYIEEAERIGARYFNIPKPVWDRMTEAQQRAANVKFLDRAIARGSEIRLASSPFEARNLTGAFADEIRYLLKRGYTISSDGKRMIPPPE